MHVNPLIGKKVVAVYLADDNKAIKFDLEDGKPIIARTDGDCCSFSWIENVQSPENLIGIINKVEDIEMAAQDQEVDGSLIQFYGCKITTEHGDCILDYRNESNGYYGGDLVWPEEDFYGGGYTDKTLVNRYGRGSHDAQVAA